MLGQDVFSCGATRLDVIFHIHSCILTYADSFYEASLRRPYSFHFCLPLEVHSDLHPLSHLTDAATLLERIIRPYLLFFNGLLTYITKKGKCQDGYIVKER